MPTQSSYARIHQQHLARIAKQLRAEYLKIIKEVSKLVVPLSLNVSGEFYFRNYPAINKKVNKLLKTMYKEVYGGAVLGINSEWDLAVEKNNEIARQIFGKDLKDLPNQYRDKYFSNNAAARQAFVYRADGGLKLSQKVWNNTKQFKQELELALEQGIGKGKSASSLAKSITSSLNDPDKLFRRVRDKNGVLRLSKAAKAYNPGQGRYRSSYKNAFRLTRNETNFSYERSQGEKRKQQDFIVGVEIKVSPQHKASDDKGGISCLSLQGKYPKGFDFTYKWHVNCICTSFNILKTPEELDKDVNKILDGKKPNTRSKNQVTGLPKSYTNYLGDNKNKWKNWKSQPRTFEGNKGLKP